MTTRSLSHDKDFYADAFWDWPIDYYRNPDGRDLAGEVLDGEDWAYVILEPCDLESFVSSDLLEAHQLLIMANGLALFKAYGKYKGLCVVSVPLGTRALFKQSCFPGVNVITMIG